MSVFRKVQYLFLLSALAFLSTAQASDWVQTWSGAGGGEDKAVAVKVDAAGNVYVLANITDEQEEVSVATIGVIKYDAAGDEKWDWPYVLREDDVQPRAVGFVLDEDNHAIYVAGYCERPDSGEQFLVFKIVEDEGEPDWGWTFGTPPDYSHAVTFGDACDADEDDIPSGIALGPNGGFIAIAGTSALADENKGQDYSVLSLYPNGDTVGLGFWTWNEGGNRDNVDDSARAMTVGDNGVIYVTGTCYHPSGEDEHLTFCTMAWQSNGNGAPGWNTDAKYVGNVKEAIPTRVAVSGGCAVVAGTFEDEENRGILTACYNGYANRSEVKFEVSDEENFYGSSLFPVGRSLIVPVPSVRLVNARYTVTSRCVGSCSAVASQVVQA